MRASENGTIDEKGPRSNVKEMKRLFFSAFLSILCANFGISAFYPCFFLSLRKSVLWKNARPSNRSSSGGKKVRSVPSIYLADIVRRHRSRDRFMACTTRGGRKTDFEWRKFSSQIHKAKKERRGMKLRLGSHERKQKWNFISSS